jgi:hypothetical protein
MKMPNKNFIVYSDSGEILRTGNCPENAFHLQAEPGEHILEGVACCQKDSIDPESCCVIEGGRPVQEAAVPAAASSSSESPRLSTQSQLDLLWQAMDAGTFPKAEPFYSAIKAQKEAAV